MKAERHTPLTASITGIDGAGKSTVSEIVTSQLPPGVRVAKISRPVYAVTEEGKLLKYEKLMRVVDNLHSFADSKASKRLSLAANALDVLLQGRFIELRMISNIKPELVLGTRDYLIDPSVYAIFYSKLLAGKTPEQRVDIFRRLTGSSVRDVIFFLTVPPDEAVARIERRIEAEKVGVQNASRLKWRHMHEEAEHLANLQTEYYRVLDVVRMKGSPEIHEIDTSRYSQYEVADLISSTLQRHLDLRKGTPSQD